MAWKKSIVVPCSAANPLPTIVCPSQPTEKHHRERPEQSSPLNESVVSAASALNRLAASNGEITITTTHGPSGTAGVKASPSSMHSPKTEEDDLLNDSPGEFQFSNSCSLNLIKEADGRSRDTEIMVE